MSAEHVAEAMAIAEAARAVAVLARHSQPFRDDAVAAGILRPLLSLVEHARGEVLSRVIQALDALAGSAETVRAVAGSPAQLQVVEAVLVEGMAQPADARRSPARGGAGTVQEEATNLLVNAAQLLGRVAEATEGRVLQLQQRPMLFPALLGMLTCRQDAACAAAATCLQHLAAAESNRQAVLQQGGLPQLVALLHPESCEAVITAAAAALAALIADGDSALAALRSGNMLQTLVQYLTQRSDATKAASSNLLAQLASADDAASIIIGREGALQPLVELCGRSSGAELQAAALKAVLGLAHTETNAEELMSLRIMPLLVDLLVNGRSMVVKGLATKSIRAITGACPAARSRVVRCRGVFPLVHLLGCGFLDTAEAAAGTLSNISREGATAISKCGALKSLCALLSAEPDSVLTTVLRALRSLCIESVDNKRQLVRLGVLAQLAQLMQASAVPVGTAAVQLHNTLAANFKEGKESLLSAGSVPVLTALLQHTDPQLQELACRGLFVMCKTQETARRVAAEHGAQQWLSRLRSSVEQPVRAAADQALSVL